MARARLDPREEYGSGSDPPKSNNFSLLKIYVIFSRKIHNLDVLNLHIYFDIYFETSLIDFGGIVDPDPGV